MTKHGIYEAEFKALPQDGEERGRFEAIVSVFGNVDRMGDRVVEGAFKNTLEEWNASGKRIPVIWSHDWGNPFAHIGEVVKAEEVPGRGLKVVADVDLTEPFSAQVYKVMKRGIQFSFAYDVRKEKKAEDGANELLDLKLIEVGPTLVGANESTELLAIKSQLEDAADKSMEPEGEKAGRSISTKNESLLRTAFDAIGTVLESLGKTDEEAKPEPEGKREADMRLLELKGRILKEGD